MRSLRARLALLVGIGTFVVVGLASMLVVRQNWQRADATLTDDVIAVAGCARILFVSFCSVRNLGREDEG